MVICPQDWREVARPAEFRLHKPHPLLARQANDPKYLPVEHRLFRKVNDILRHKILDARRGGEPAKTLVFGPNRFADFPLVEFLEKGIVFGLDINLTAMSEARARLSGTQKKRLGILGLDASLFASRVITETARVIEGHPKLTDKTLNDLTKAYAGLEKRGTLPFNNSSMEMITSVSCAHQFLGMAAECILSILIEKYGERAALEFLLENDGVRFDALANGLNPLSRRMVRTHLEEVKRITRPGGIIFISEHSLRARIVNDTGSFRLSPSELSPAYDFIQDSKAATGKSSLQVKVGEAAEGIEIVGEDGLEELLGEVAGLQVLERFYFWNLNSPGNAMLGIHGTYFLDTALVIRSE